MPILSKNAFAVTKNHVRTDVPHGTAGTPYTKALDVAVTLTADELKQQLGAVPDHLAVVAHVPVSAGDDTAWKRWVLVPEGPRQVGYRGSVTVLDFAAAGIPNVDIAALMRHGVWFSVETAGTSTITQTPTSTKIDTTPGDTLAYAQGFGDNFKPST